MNREIEEKIDEAFAKVFGMIPWLIGAMVVYIGVDIFQKFWCE